MKFTDTNKKQTSDLQHLHTATWNRVSMAPYQDCRILIYDVTQSYLQTQTTRSSEASRSLYMYICFFFNNAASSADCTAQHVWWIIIWKGRGRKWCCPFSSTRLVCTRRTEENHKQPLPRQAVARAGFKPGTSEYGTWMLQIPRCCNPWEYILTFHHFQTSDFNTP